MCKTKQIYLVRGEETCGGGLSVCDGREVSSNMWRRRWRTITGNMMASMSSRWMSSSSQLAGRMIALLRALMTTVTPMALELCGFFVGFFCVTTRLVRESVVLCCGVTSVCVEPVSLETTTFTKDCTLLSCYKLTTAATKKSVHPIASHKQ